MNLEAIPWFDNQQSWNWTMGLCFPNPRAHLHDSAFQSLVIRQHTNPGMASQEQSDTASRCTTSWKMAPL